MTETPDPPATPPQPPDKAKKDKISEGRVDAGGARTAECCQSGNRSTAGAVVR